MGSSQSSSASQHAGAVLEQHHPSIELKESQRAGVRAMILTAAIIAGYAVIMFVTNSRFTILDDESTIVAVAGHPIAPTVSLFLFGKGQHEHPPLSDIFLHLWLIATHYSFFALRIFANLFFISAMLLTALSAKRIAGRRAYWTTLGVGLVWPFAFQYGRITGWYCVTMFFISLVTWLYIKVTEGGGVRTWLLLALASMALVWSNYFGIAILVLLVVDLLAFHRDVARENLRPLLMSVAAVAMSILPLVSIVLRDLAVKAAPASSHLNWKNDIAVIGYPTFSIFGSVAVAPWFLPLSIPVFAATIALFVSLWFSPARKWLVYFGLSLVLLQLSGHMNVKRVLFLTPWLFLGIGVAAFGDTCHYRKLTWAAIATLVAVGWIGIVSGRHYSTTNLYEPWRDVAQTVAGDALRGATVISESPPFFFYLDYALKLQGETKSATGPYLGEEIYGSRGYRILYSSEPDRIAGALTGKVVLVNGSALGPVVEQTNTLNRRLLQDCRMEGEYHATPDPSAAFKRTLVQDYAALNYRVNVNWYDCGIGRSSNENNEHGR